MFTKEKSNEIISAVKISDSYSLGSHWVYDKTQLLELPINWERLNAPQAMWHKGKKAGDFTHIGDQLQWLDEYVQDNNTFEPSNYLTFWQEKMTTYDGYIDGATRNTLANIEAGNNSGSNSDDFSVIGRITPLLLISQNEDEFISHVEAFVKLSHNSVNVIESAIFFARLLFRVSEGKNIAQEISSLKNAFNAFIIDSVDKGIASKSENTFDAIRNFGPACGVEEGFSGIIHLLTKYPKNLKELLIQNAKAGGDTSSRAMVATMIFVVNKSSEDIPKEWFDLNIDK